MSTLDNFVKNEIVVANGDIAEAAYWTFDALNRNLLGIRDLFGFFGTENERYMFKHVFEAYCGNIKLKAISVESDVLLDIEDRQKQLECENKSLITTINKIGCIIDGDISNKVERILNRDTILSLVKDIKDKYDTLVKESSIWEDNCQRYITILDSCLYIADVDNYQKERINVAVNCEKVSYAIRKLKDTYNALLESNKILQSHLTHVTTERDNWIKTAKEYGNNAEYYRNLIIKCGELINEEVYIHNVDSIDVLCAKVPELVEKLMHFTKIKPNYDYLQMPVAEDDTPSDLDISPVEKKSNIIKSADDSNKKPITKEDFLRNYGYIELNGMWHYTNYKTESLVYLPDNMKGITYKDTKESIQSLRYLIEKLQNILDTKGLYEVNLSICNNNLMLSYYTLQQESKANTIFRISKEKEWDNTIEEKKKQLITLLEELHITDTSFVFDLARKY